MTGSALTLLREQRVNKSLLVLNAEARACFNLEDSDTVSNYLKWSTCMQS